MTDFADRFHEIDSRIAESIRASDAARRAMERARTPRSYERAVDALQRAHDAHTAAWADRNALCAEWEKHFATEYGNCA